MHEFLLVRQSRFRHIVSVSLEDDDKTRSGCASDIGSWTFLGQIKRNTSIFECEISQYPQVVIRWSSKLIADSMRSTIQLGMLGRTTAQHVTQKHRQRYQSITRTEYRKNILIGPSEKMSDVGSAKIISMQNIKLHGGSKQQKMLEYGILCLYLVRVTNNKVKD